jgi:hypothetical protein
VVGAVLEAHNHSLEIDRPASDLERERSVARIVVNVDCIVIPPSVDIRAPELLPSVVVATAPLRARDNAQTEQQQQ